MPGKPTVVPRFASTVSGVEPPEGKKDIGWVSGEQPPAGWLNWLFKYLTEFASYLNAPNNITLGTDVQATEAGAVAARLTVDAAASAVADWTCLFSGENVRLWVHHTDGFALTVNATRPANGTDTWTKISNAASALIVQLAAESFRIGGMPEGQDTAWTDAYVSGEGTTSGWGRIIELHTDLEADTDAEADTAMLSVLAPSTSVERKLVFEWLHASANPIRVYYTTVTSAGVTSGSLEIVVNAKYGNASGNWTADLAQPATRYIFGRSGIKISQKVNASAGATWSDAGWDFDAAAQLALPTATTGATDHTHWLLENGQIKFPNSDDDDLSDTNPPSTAVVPPNSFGAKHLSKAWGSLSIAAGTYTVEDGVNIATFTEPSEDTLRVTFATAMANALYAPIIAPAIDDANFICVAKVTARATTHFDFIILRSDPATGIWTSLDVDARTLIFFLDVKARQDS